MLLVNWKESKSSGKQNSTKSRGWFCFAPCFFLSIPAYSAPENYTSSTSIVSIFLSLLLVIGIVFMLAYLMRRFNVTPSSSSQMKVVSSMVAGTRERIMVIDVAGEQHLVGVTAHNINHLAKLEKPLAESPSSPQENFKEKLTMFMAGKINPNLDATGSDKNTNAKKDKS